MKGIFVTFEGPDGSGKTSVLNSVVEMLNQTSKKNDYILTREPGGNRISEDIRGIVLDPRNTEMDEKTEALLYAAARRQHLVDTILPALNEGKLVLCDRFVDSSLAYQGAGRHIGVYQVAKINEFATDGLQPDLTFYFDIEPEVGLARIKNHRQDEVNRLDQESLQFYEDVRAQYLCLARENPKRIIKIDARKSLADVTAQVLALLENKLAEFFK
ncbi:dTMP kinase [Ligilactobacillus sp. Marseille-Q7487]|uniref:dTMP kinase n=1 Tax=Ligilactobacillus sp. Marseille-Q7487 TaxID=3022128 RepID=UPI0015B6C803|nr:dTMP kinase [Ligilactobacillus sp. Marseille-Q7487]